jgi:hypothetical protein
LEWTQSRTNCLIDELARKSKQIRKPSKKQTNKQTKYNNKKTKQKKKYTNETYMKAFE